MISAYNLIKMGSVSLKCKEISSCELDSEILLSKVLNCRREDLLINLDNKIEQKKINEFKNLIKRRLAKEPIAYITEKKEFWSKDFYVNKNTLIPRPETEILVEKLVKIFDNRAISILDIGVGSGCIIISLLNELKKSTGIGVDISKNALVVAKKNLGQHKLLNKVKLYRKSFTELHHKKFDLIVSNPPYIDHHKIKNLQEDIKNYEPLIALDGGNDGLDVIKKVIYKARVILKINGILALEIGNGQFKRVKKILKRNNFRVKENIKDFNNNIRCLIAVLNKYE